MAGRFLKTDGRPCSLRVVRLVKAPLQAAAAFPPPWPVLPDLANWRGFDIADGRLGIAYDDVPICLELEHRQGTTKLPPLVSAV
jgi:hypothetical protein